MLVAMSANVYQCQKCHVDCVYVRAVRLTGPMYGVEWRCPKCDGTLLDMCPIGPVIPTAQSCLNCGEQFNETGDDAVCPSCGMTSRSALESFGLGPMHTHAMDLVAGLMQKGLIRRAIAIANLTVLANPQNEAAWRVKYSFLSKLGFGESALAVLEKLMHIANDPELMIARGFSLQSAGRHAEAVEAYRKYLRDTPDGPSVDIAFCNMANSLHVLKDEAGAEGAYRQAITKNPKRATNYANFFRLLYGQKRYDEAHAIVDQGLACADDGLTGCRLLEDKALLFAEQMKGAEGLQYADMAIKRGANGVRVHYLRGRALALLGQLDEARDEMLQVLQLDSKNADGLRGLAMIDKALASP